MQVFLNGHFVPEDQALVSVFDRSFRYGDGVFEAVLACRGRLFRWAPHAERLQRGAAFTRLRLTMSTDEMERAACELLQRNSMPEAVVRLQVSRGSGARGYAPSGEEQPVVVISAHAPPPRGSQTKPWKLTVCSHRATDEQLAQHKTCSRIVQVLAACEARERGADEALLVNARGEICEGSTSNVFWIQGETVCTPPLALGALPGVTRAAVREVCEQLGWSLEERVVRPEELPRAHGVFLSMTTRGVVEVESLGGVPLPRSPLVPRLQSEIEALMERDCGG
jgi:branched-chain amino acid aminotransferase